MTPVLLVLLLGTLCLGSAFFEELFGEGNGPSKSGRERRTRDRSSRRRAVIEESLLSFLLLECESYLAERFGGYDEVEQREYLRQKRERDESFAADLVDVYGVTEADVLGAGETALAEIERMMRDKLDGLIERLRTEMQEPGEGGLFANDTAFEEELDWS